METRQYILPMNPSLSDFKRHLRITSDDLDDQLLPLLMAGVDWAEGFVGRTIALSSYSISSSFAPSVRLHAPAISVDSVRVDGETRAFHLEGDTLIIYGFGEQMEITYTAGMRQIPFDMRAAIFLKAGKMFDQPTDHIKEKSDASEHLLRRYRTYGDRS